MWNNKIPRKDRPLSLKDVVCSLHFVENDFLKDEYKMPDGTIIFGERKRPAFKKNAIPTIFLGFLDRFSDLKIKRAPPKQRKLNYKKICKNSESNDHVFDINPDKCSPNE